MLGDRLNLLDGLNFLDHDELLVGFNIQLLLKALLNVIPVRRHVRLLVLRFPQIPMSIFVI